MPNIKKIKLIIALKDSYVYIYIYLLFSIFQYFDLIKEIFKHSILILKLFVI